MQGTSLLSQESLLSPHFNRFLSPGEPLSRAPLSCDHCNRYLDVCNFQFPVSVSRNHDPERPWTVDTRALKLLPCPSPQACSRDRWADHPQASVVAITFLVQRLPAPASAKRRELTNAGTSIGETMLSRIPGMRLPCPPCDLFHDCANLELLCVPTVAAVLCWILGPGFLITLTWLMQLPADSAPEHRH